MPLGKEATCRNRIGRGTWIEIEGCGIFGTWQCYGEDTAAYRFAKSGENAGSSPPGVDGGMDD